MSSEEFSLHLAYWRIEPSGPGGEMQRWAALMAAVNNGGLSKKDKTLFRPDEFWSPDVWAVPEEPKPGTKKRLAPDFSHLRGMKVRKVKR
jgi:hypothetical protein